MGVGSALTPSDNNLSGTGDINLSLNSSRRPHRTGPHVERWFARMLSPMTDAPQPGADPQSGFARLVRDVGVNVLANLIAAPILYLIGVALGLLPRQRTAIIGAAAMLSATVALLFYALAVLLKRRAASTGMAIGFALSTSAFLVLLPSLLPGFPDWLRITIYVTQGAVWTTSGVIAVVRWRWPRRTQTPK